MPDEKSKAAAELFERVGRALAGGAPDWQHHLADWLQVRRDTVRDWRNGRMEPRPQVWADLLSLIADRRADLAKVEAEVRAWLACQPSDDRT
jgi:hypothetical protein